MKIRKLKGDLELSNKGNLTIFPVGSGSAFTKLNYQNNYLLIKNNKHIMIDCGTRAPEALFRLGRSVIDIENYYITHSHADHIGGLEEVMLMGRYVAQKKPNIIISKEYQEILWNYSLRGGGAWNEAKKTGFLEFEDLWVPHRPREFNGLNRQAWEIDYAGFHLIFFRTMHYPNSAITWEDSAYSTGVIIDKFVLFSADTRFDEELITDITSMFDIEVIFHDVQFFPGGIHAQFEELKTLPADIRARILLMHYPDNYEQYEKQVLEAGFKGFVKQHHYYDFPGRS